MSYDHFQPIMPGLKDEETRVNGLQKSIALLAIYGVAGLLHSQVDFPVAGRQIQIHGFLSEGFAYSNDNNYLTMAKPVTPSSFSGTNLPRRVHRTLTARGDAELQGTIGC